MNPVLRGLDGMALQVCDQLRESLDAVVGVSEGVVTSVAEQVTSNPCCVIVIN